MPAALIAVLTNRCTWAALVTAIATWGLTSWWQGLETAVLKAKHRSDMQTAIDKQVEACNIALDKQQEIADDLHARLAGVERRSADLMQRYGNRTVTVHTATCGDLSAATAAGTVGPAGQLSESIEIGAGRLADDYAQWQREREMLRTFQKACGR